MKQFDGYTEVHMEFIEDFRNYPKNNVNLSMSSQGIDGFNLDEIGELFVRFLNAAGYNYVTGVEFFKGDESTNEAIHEWCGTDDCCGECDDQMELELEDNDGH